MAGLKRYIVLLLAFNYVEICFGNDNAKCDKDLEILDNARTNREHWALKCELQTNFNDEVSILEFQLVFDTWANLPSGIIHGNVQSPGHFFECVKFRHNDIRGQHCMITATGSANESSLTSYNWRQIGPIVREYDLTLVLGICLPESCSLERVIDYSTDILTEADMIAIAATCKTDDAASVEAIDIFAM